MSDETPAGTGEPTPEAGAVAPGSAEPATPTPPPTADEAVTAPSTPAPSAEPATTSEVASEAPTAAASADPAAGNAAAAAESRRRGVFVPAWAAVVLGVLVVAGLGFLVGWIVAPSDDSSPSNASVTLPNGRTLPNLPNLPGTNNGNGNGNSSGNGSSNGSSNGNGTQTPAAGTAFLGVSVDVATGDGGATISSVADGSPAANAGLKTGDVVTAVDGTKVTSPLDLVRAIRSNEPGDSITVTYTRNGTSADAKVTLANTPSTQPSS